MLPRSLKQMRPHAHKNRDYGTFTLDFGRPTFILLNQLYFILEYAMDLAILTETQNTSALEIRHTLAFIIILNIIIGYNPTKRYAQQQQKNDNAFLLSHLVFKSVGIQPVGNLFGG